MPDHGLLTVQHRRAQLVVRAAATREFARLWPIWTGDDQSFNTLVAAAVPLVSHQHAISAAVSGRYYEQARRAERPGGKPHVVLPAPLDVDKLRVGLYTTGRNMTQRALDAGYSPQAAMAAALVRTSGTATRFTLAGGRDTLVDAVREDPRARGYERVLGGGSCDFCASLAGQVGTEDFSAHDHCGCVAAPAWS